MGFGPTDMASMVLENRYVGNGGRQTVFVVEMPFQDSL